MADWYLQRDGKPTGPFSREALEQMLAAKLVTLESKVWKAGFEQWHEMSNTAEFGGEPDDNRYDLPDEPEPLPRRGVTIARGAAMTPMHSKRKEADLDALANMVGAVSTRQSVSAQVQERVIATGQMTRAEKQRLQIGVSIGALVVIAIVVAYFAIFNSWERQNAKAIRDLAAEVAYAGQMNRPSLAIQSEEKLKQLLDHRVLQDPELAKLVATSSATANAFRTLAQQSAPATASGPLAVSSGTPRNRPFPAGAVKQGIQQRLAKESPAFSIVEIDIGIDADVEYPYTIEIAVTSPKRKEDPNVAAEGKYTFRVSPGYELSPKYTFDQGEDSVETQGLTRYISETLKEIRTTPQ